MVGVGVAVGVGVVVAMTPPTDSRDFPSGRCARCRGNAVLERMPCEECKGQGKIERDHTIRHGDTVGDESVVALFHCNDCDGIGYTESTPCCGWPLLDESAGVDAAYERRAERSGSGEKAGT